MDYWNVADSELGIVVTCKGHDKNHTVHAATQAFRRAAAARKGPFTVIADLREMTGYETEARVAWQEAMYDIKKQVVRLILVGARSAMIRIGATTVGAFARVPVKFVATWDEVRQLGPRSTPPNRGRSGIGTS